MVISIVITSVRTVVTHQSMHFIFVSVNWRWPEVTFSMLLLSTTVHSENYNTWGPSGFNCSRSSSGNKRWWPYNALREKRMKAAASFQVFRTVFCTAIIIKQVQKIQKIMKTYCISRKSEGKITVSQDQENESRLSQCYQSLSYRFMFFVLRNNDIPSRLSENANALPWFSGTSARAEWLLPYRKLP